jgi:CBS domain-containing protein
MKVKDIMTSDPVTCTPRTTLASAAHLMWEADCGVLPVVHDGKLVGVVTDRDMFIALATRDRRASTMAVGEVLNRPVLTCGPEDDVHDAMATMKRSHVRRLPVVGFGDTVLGVISMNDIVLATTGAARELRSDEVVETFQSICAHQHPVAQLVTA